METLTWGFDYHRLPCHLCSLVHDKGTTHWRPFPSSVTSLLLCSDEMLVGMRKKRTSIWPLFIWELELKIVKVSEGRGLRCEATCNETVSLFTVRKTWTTVQCNNPKAVFQASDFSQLPQRCSWPSGVNQWLPTQSSYLLAPSPSRFLVRRAAQNTHSN